MFFNISEQTKKDFLILRYYLVIKGIFQHNKKVKGETKMIVKNNQTLTKLIDEALEKDKPVTFKTNKGAAIIIPEEKYNSMIETIFLVSQPGLVEKIKKGEKEDIDSMRSYNSKESW